jgi:hypothetical protein
MVSPVMVSVLASSAEVVRSNPGRVKTSIVICCFSTMRAVRAKTG